MKFKVYTTSWCPYCVTAKRLLEEKGYEYEEINIEKLDMTRDDLEKITGGRSVPQIVMDDQPIGGFENLQAMAVSGNL